MSDPDLSSFIWSVAVCLHGDYEQSEFGKTILGSRSDLLREGRTALISAPANGQVDVRHLAEKKAA
jgi:hypothetical protein